MIGTEFVPEEDRGEFHVLVDLPPGTSFDESVARIADVERKIRQACRRCGRSSARWACDGEVRDRRTCR